MLKINKFKIILFFLFSFTLFLGLYFQEDSAGGAKHDYNFLINFIQSFSQSLSVGLEYFLSNDGSKIHSPVFYILVAPIFKLFNNFEVIKIFNIVISCILPFIFYLNLKIKFKTDTNYIFLFSLIIFLSPYFRSSAIWVLGDNLALIFFSLFSLHIQKILNDKSFIKSYYLASSFIIFATYVRYYYCIYFFIIIFILIKNNLATFNNIFKILFFSFLLALPMIVYFIYIFFFYKFSNTLEMRFSFNYLNTGFYVYLIFLFYLLVFLIPNFKEFYFHYKKNYKNFFFLFLILFLFFNLDFLFFGFIDLSSNYGGGIVKKFFSILNINSYFLVVPFIFSFLIVDYFFKENRQFNYLVLALVIFSLPLKIIFQKYLDPLFFLVFFCLIKSECVKKIFNKQQLKISILFLYFFGFLILANVYYLLPNIL